MVLFRERLHAAITGYVSSALIIPASLIVFAPINFIAGIVCAIVLYATCVIVLMVTAPTIEVTEDTLRAGRAHIDRSMLGNAVFYTGDEAFQQRGQKLDARAWLLLRGWIKPVVVIPILDQDDPTPYWLLSTRRPGELVRVLNDHAATKIAPTAE